MCFLQHFRHQCPFFCDEVKHYSAAQTDDMNSPFQIQMRL